MPKLHVEIAAFVRAEPTANGAGVKLMLVDAGGQTLVLVLPVAALGELLAGLPHPLAVPEDGINDVKGWRLDQAASGATGPTLTLRTSEGRSAAFRLTSAQLAGIATLARYSKPPPPQSRSLH